MFGIIDWVKGTEEVTQNQSFKIENQIIPKRVHNVKRNQSFENLQDHSQINVEQFIFRDVNPQVHRIRSN